MFICIIKRWRRDVGVAQFDTLERQEELHICTTTFDLTCLTPLGLFWGKFAPLAPPAPPQTCPWSSEKHAALAEPGLMIYKTILHNHMI
jgi:hypothetical protein